MFRQMSTFIRCRSTADAFDNPAFTKGPLVYTLVYLVVHPRMEAEDNNSLDLWASDGSQYVIMQADRS